MTRWLKAGRLQRDSLAQLISGVIPSIQAMISVVMSSIDDLSLSHRLFACAQTLMPHANAFLPFYWGLICALRFAAPTNPCKLANRRRHGLEHVTMQHANSLFLFSSVE